VTVTVSPLHIVRLNFNGAKRYRRFSFLPRVGDRVNVTDDGTMFCLDVNAVWFDDRYGEDECEVQLNCRGAEEHHVGKEP
jgi:hypothetical protein